jgi:hypothetical protein
MRLTKASVAKLSLPNGKIELLIFDETLPGFGVRLRYGGKRTWIVQYRVGAKQRRLSLGSIQTIDADEARKRARTALSKVHLGVDPHLEKVNVRIQASVTIDSKVEGYLAHLAEKGRKSGFIGEVRRYLQVHWSPFREVALHSVTRAMVASRLAEITKINGPYAANRARAALSAFYSWAIGEGLADSNPRALASLFEPVPSVDEIGAERQLIFKNRKRGRRTREDVRRLEIAFKIVEIIRKSDQVEAQRLWRSHRNTGFPKDPCGMHGVNIKTPSGFVRELQSKPRIDCRRISLIRPMFGLYL